MGIYEELGIRPFIMDPKTSFPPISSLPLVEGTFLSRPNRFAVHCAIDGRETKAFMPNPGRMGELLLPDAELILGSSPVFS